MGTEASCLTLDSPCWDTEFQSLDFGCPPFQSTEWETCFDSWSQPLLCSKMPCAAPVAARPGIGGLTPLAADWRITLTFVPDILPDAPIQFVCGMVGSVNLTMSLGEYLDPFFEQVILLQHCDDPYGYRDWSQDGRLPGEQHNGGGEAPRFDTVIKKFGTTSYYLPGANDAENVYVMGPSSRDPTLTGLFTQEAFVYPVENKLAQIVGHYDGTSISANASHVRMMANGHLQHHIRNEFTSNEFNVESTDVIPLNEWSHVAVTRDAANVIRLFIKGKLQPNTLTWAGNLIGDLQRLIVGGQRNGTVRKNLFHGYIDEARITNNVCRYTVDFAEPTVAFPNDPMRFSSAIFNMIGSFTGNLYDPNVDDQIDKVSLLLHLDGADNSQVFYDDSKYNRTVQRWPSSETKLRTTVKKFGTASLYCDGANDGIWPVADAAELDLTTGDFTVEFQMAASTNSFAANTARLLTRRKPGYAGGGIASDYQYSVYIDSANNLSAFVVSNTDAITGFGLDVTWKNQAFHHVAMTRWGDRFTLWVDGVDKGNVLLPGIVLKTGVPMNTWIGVQCDYNGLVGSYWGYIDEVRITKGHCRYTGAFVPPTKAFPSAPATFACTMTSTATLSAAFAGIPSDDVYFQQVQLLLHGDSMVDHSAAKAPVVSGGGAVIVAAPAGFLGNGWMSAPAQGAFVSVADAARLHPAAGDFTYEFAFYWPGAGNPASFQYMLGHGDSTGTNVGTTIGFAITTASKLYVDVCSGATAYEIYSPTTVTHNVRHTCAACRVGNTMYLFLDGVLQGTISLAGVTLNDTTGKLSVLRLGDFVTAAYSFPGQIEEVRVTIGVGRYTANYTPATVPFPDAVSVDPYAASVYTHLRGKVSTYAVDYCKNPRAFVPSGNAGQATDILKFTDANNYALTFDGAGDYFSEAANASHSLNGVDATLEGWHYLTGYPNNDLGAYEEMIFSTYAAAQPTGWQYGFIGTASSITGINIYDGAAGFFFPFAFQLGTWYHVAMTKQGTNLRVFVNGVQIGTTQTSTGAWAGGTAPLGLGWLNYLASGYPKYYKGRMQEIRFTRGVARYTANFSPPFAPFPADYISDPLFDKVALLLQCNGVNTLSVLTDHSKYNATVVRVGSAAVDTALAKFGNGSLLNPNTSSNFQIAEAPQFYPGAGDFCIEGFVYALTGSSQNIYMAGKLNATWVIETYGTQLNIRVFSAGPTTHEIREGVGLPLNAWQHVAIERVGSMLYLLREGAVRGSLNIGSVPLVATAGYLGLFSFGDVAGARWGSGRWDGFRMTIGANRYGGAAYTVPQFAFANV